MAKYNAKTWEISYESSYLKADRGNKKIAVKNSDKITLISVSAILMTFVALSLVGTVATSVIFDIAIKLCIFGALIYSGTKLIQYLVIKQ